MDRIYLVLNEIHNGTTSPKQLFLKLKSVFKNNLIEFQLFLDDLATEAYIRFLGGNNSPKYGDIILTDKGKDYIKSKRHLADPSEFKGPCNVLGKMKCKEYFITDINNLCNTCHIRKKVASVRDTMILKYDTQKALNTKEYLIKHLNTKIDKANKKIENIINSERTGGDLHRENRVSIFLSWKDCLQYYGEQLQLIVNSGSNNKRMNDNKQTVVREVYFLSKSFSIGGKDVNGVFQIHVGNGPNEYIAKAKTKEAKDEYEKWYWGSFNTPELQREKNEDIRRQKNTDALKKLADLLNNTKLFDLSIPIEKIELLELKREFDKIKTYPEKLAWWGEKGLYKFCYHSIFLTDFSSENEKPENRLTIYPETNEEIRLFNEFSFKENMKNKEFGGDLDHMINRYWDRIKSGANGIEYTKREIAKYKGVYDEAKKFNLEKCNNYAGNALYKFFVVGYNASTDGNITDLFSNKLLITKMGEVAYGFTAEQYIRFLDKQLSLLEQGKSKIFPVSQIETNHATETLKTNTDRLQNELKKYGFHTLEFIKILSDESLKKLIEIFVVNGLPYKIAMIEYVGFITHLEKEHFDTKNELYKGISAILNADERSVKGNILVLNENSNENKARYTAYQHKLTVEKDYLNIK